MLLGLAACGPHYDDDTSLRNLSGQQPIYDGETTHVVGRHLTQSDGSQVLSWPGSAVSTRFTGNGVTASLKLLEGQKQTFFNVVLDGNDLGPLTVDTNSTLYTVQADGDGPHDLTLVKMNEAMDSVVAFGGFTPASGALQPTARPTGRRLLLIGDSITCGYGNLGVITTQALTSSQSSDANSLRDCNYFLGKQVYQVSNAYQAYGTQAARHLQAEWQLVSWSGKGVYRNADGTQSETMADIWQRAVATDGNTQYAPADFVPQAVVINLGTNDFGSIAESQNPGGGPPSIPTFKARYLTILRGVRKAFPSAWIFVATGPMLSDYYPTTFKALSTMRTTLADLIDTMGDHRVR
ncbi:GDSL-type esterase/lipase family protein, partial [Jatrophihabitans endophyticus]|uniref:GDSL-type esterase/lipase family protein n=1 Tax=Jatrophihabitans endophyticus TaxID=1206085 RepID=UPI0019E68130